MNNLEVLQSKNINECYIPANKNVKLDYVGFSDFRIDVVGGVSPTYVLRSLDNIPLSKDIILNEFDNRSRREILQNFARLCLINCLEYFTESPIDDINLNDITIELDIEASGGISLFVYYDVLHPILNLKERMTFISIRKCFDEDNFIEFISIDSKGDSLTVLLHFRDLYDKIS